jgi:hypothetical protein
MGAQEVTRLIRTGRGERRSCLNTSIIRTGPGEKGRSCLNAGIIRTGQGKKSKVLSEYRYHSDGQSRKKQEAVRKQFAFRQSNVKKNRPCLNTDSIQ